MMVWGSERCRCDECVWVILGEWVRVWEGGVVFN